MRQQTMYIRMKKAVMTILTVALIFVGLWVPKQDVMAVTQEYSAEDLTVYQEIIADGEIYSVNKIIIDGSDVAENNTLFNWTNVTPHSLYVIENSVSEGKRIITLSSSTNPVSLTKNTIPQPTQPSNDWEYTADDMAGFGAKSNGTLLAPYFTVPGATLTGEYQGELWRNEIENELLTYGGTLIGTLSLKKDNGKDVSERILDWKLVTGDDNVIGDSNVMNIRASLAVCYKNGDDTVVTPLTESIDIDFGNNGTLAIGIATIAGDDRTDITDITDITDLYIISNVNPQNLTSLLD